MIDEKVQKLREMINNAQKVVFFGGAGVSTESGVPDFRSTDGLYHQKWKYPPETILSHSFFMTHTGEFYDFYRQKMLFPKARPNRAHEALTELERRGKLFAVITQNIDGLHQAAGSQNVIELHGTVHKNRCMRCKKEYPGLGCVMDTDGVPHCTCGGIIKPQVILYEESLNENDIVNAVEAVAGADLLIIGGTSLTVYPAAAFVSDCRCPIAVINRSPTQMDRRAALVLDQPIGRVLGAAVFGDEA